MGAWTEKMGKDYMKRVKKDFTDEIIAEREKKSPGFAAKVAQKILKKQAEDLEKQMFRPTKKQRKVGQNLGGLMSAAETWADSIGVAATAAVNEARKNDTEKPRMELLSRVALEGMAQVLTFGAKKYDPHNWRRGFEWGRLAGAAMRHLMAFISGEDTDPESGLPHIDHLACCVMFLSEHQKKHLGTDDRYQGAR